MQHNQPGMVQKVIERRSAFAFAFVVLFATTFGFLSVVGATPDASAAPTPADVVEPAARASSAAASHTTHVNGELPVRITAKDIGLDVSVQNPTSTDVDVLDRAALQGAVRYPTSASLGQNGTLLLFGHSSYLPIVHNQVYKTFDGVQNLKEGSVISVYSGDAEYRYSVVGVEVANATRDVVELNPVGKHLTIVTCDSFLTKQNRFVVTADFVGAYSLVSN